jgi:hypothetical protein
MGDPIAKKPGSRPTAGLSAGNLAANLNRTESSSRSRAAQQSQLSPWFGRTAHETRLKAAQIACDRKGASLFKRVFAKAACKNACGFRARFEAGLGIVRRVANHHRIRAGEREFPERYADKARVRLAVLNVVTARGRGDEFACIQQSKIALECRPLAISRESNPAAMLRHRPENIADTIKGSYTRKIPALIDCALLLENLPALTFRSFRHGELQRLVTIVARIKLEGLKGNL